MKIVDTSFVIQFTLGYQYEGVVKIAQGRHCMHISTEGSLDIAESDNDFPYGPKPLTGLTLYNMDIPFVITVVNIYTLVIKFQDTAIYFKEMKFSILYLHRIHFNIYFCF